MEQQKKPRKSPPPRRKTTHSQGDWTWNHDNLKSKIARGATEDACCSWTGSSGPETHLFGGFKNNVAQMTQARRLYWMGEKNEDIAMSRITMTCNNSYCMNIGHMKLAPNLKFFKNDGITPAEPQNNISLRLKPEPKPKVVKQPKIKVVKEVKVKLPKPPKPPKPPGIRGRPKTKQVEVKIVKQIDLTAKEEQW